MIKKILCLITLFLFSFFTTYAQIEIKGKVISKKETIAFANVVLKDQANKIASGAITEDDGSFTVSVEKGIYTLTISYIGYQEYNQEINLTEVDSVLELGTIELQTTATELDGVTVIAEKPIFQRKADRLVFNVEQSVAAQGGDALDALSVAPGVTVQDGVISMLGKSGMRVMIDGRISNLAGDELLNYLNSIQASDIKSVEIITNPPAKYEAQGNGGLINIILKRAKENSWNNSISSSYRQMILPMFTIGNNFKYRKNRVNILATANARFGDQRYIQEKEIFYSQNTWLTDTSQDRDIEDFSARFIFDYELTDNSKIGFQASASTSNPFWRDKARTDIFDNASGQLDSIIASTGTRETPSDNLSLNVHYSSKLDTLGRNISVDLDYFKFSASDARDVTANTFEANGDFRNPNFIGFNGTDREVSNYSARIDIEHPLKIFDFSYGAKVSYIDSEYDVRNIDEIFNIDQQDKFRYLERIQAVYINMFKKFNDKWSMQFGLRLENTDTQGTSGSLNITTDIDYTKLFPTFYLAYAPNDNNSYSFSYGRRINRPYFAQLNPAEFFINRFTSSTGNPFLQPSFNDNFELTHLYKGKLSTTIFFEKETDGIGSIGVADNDTFEELISPFNYYTLYRYGLSESYSFKPVSWWNSQNLLFLVNYDSRITNEALNIPERRDFSYYLSTDNTINLSEDRTKSLQINYWYSAPFTRNQTENESNQALNIGYRMSMFDKKVQLGVNFLDIFNTSPRRSIFSVNGIRSTHLGYGLFRGRGFRFSLSYNFGNDKINVRNRRTGNDEEQRRTN